MQPIINGISKFFDEITSCFSRKVNKVQKSKNEVIGLDLRSVLFNDKIFEILEGLSLGDLCRLRRVDKNFKARVDAMNISNFQEICLIVKTILMHASTYERGPAASDFKSANYYYYVINIHKYDDTMCLVFNWALTLNRQPCNDYLYVYVPEPNESGVLLKEKYEIKSALRGAKTIHRPIGVELLTSPNNPPPDRALKALQRIVKTLNEELPKKQLKSTLIS